jgi:hypothetical protein
MKFKYFLTVTVLVTAFLCFACLPVGMGTIVSAQTPEVQAMIQQLQKQIAELQVQLQVLLVQQGNGTSVSVIDSAWCHTFSANLGFANSGSSEVAALHIALGREGISYGSDSANVYGGGTASGVAIFQEKYSSSILAPNGLVHGTGYTGASTRAKLNELYKCSQSVVACTQDAKQCPDGTYVSRTGPNCEFSACPMASTCVTDWQCGVWTNCVNGQKIRSCIDFADCGVSLGKPAETQSCVSVNSDSQSSITVTSPNGGETWQVGQTKRIAWSSSGLSSTDKVSISLFIPAGGTTCDASGICMSTMATWGKSMASNISTTQGYYDWTINQSNLPTNTTNSQNYKIAVEVSGKAISDASDGYFSIIPLPSSQITVQTDCVNLWWFDSNNIACQSPKDFCGAYTYQGLKTFDNQKDCLAVAKNPSTNCTDTDNGIDYVTKGTITYKPTSSSNTRTYTDTCSGYGNKDVVEYYCDTTSSQGYGYEYHTCPNGCEAGVCKPDSSGGAVVTVISPNGGEKFEIGSSIPVKWSVTNRGTGVRVGDLMTYPTDEVYATLLRGSTVIKKERAYETVGGSGYNMKIPSDMSYLGDGYKIVLSCGSVGSFCTGDQSDGYFSIVAASVKPQLLSINPSVIYTGETMDVQISAVGFGDVGASTDCGIRFNLSGIKINNCADISTKTGSNTIKANITLLDSVSVGQHKMYGVSSTAQSNYLDYTVGIKTCRDSDSGQDYYKYGVAEGLYNGNYNNLSDYCLNDNTVREYYCSNNAVVYKDYNCPNGCDIAGYDYTKGVFVTQSGRCKQ